MKQLFFVALILLSLLPTIASADGNWTITNFHSDLTIQPDGILDVVETIDADFAGGPHHGIYRDLPFRYRFDDHDEYMTFSVKSVLRDEQSEPYSESRNSANLRIKIGDEKHTIIGSHQYRIEYTVVGALRSFTGFDELNWNVTGHAWEPVIEHASATINLPQPAMLQTACYTGPAGGASRDCAIDSESNSSVLYKTNEPIVPGSDFTIATGFRSGLVPIVTGTKPYNAFEDLRSYYLSLGLVLLSLLFFVRQWWQTGRDEEFDRSSSGPSESSTRIRPLFEAPIAIVPEYLPPNDLRPAELEVLLTESSSSKGVASTIVDLANRGYLTMTELPKTGWLGSRDYRLDRTKEPVPTLRAYEVALLKGLFVNGKSVTLKELKNLKKFEKVPIQVRHELIRGLTEAKFFIGNPQDRRNTLIYIGFGIFFLGGFAVAMLFDTAYSVSSSWIILSSAIGLLATAFYCLFFGFLAPKRSAVGTATYQKALGYKLFLQNTERYRQPFLEDQGLFLKVLPYAMVFGITTKLLKAMQQLGVNVPQPTWYVGSGAWDSSAFASEIGNLSSAVSSMSNSSASSGGGSSGGGGGGGGGGGW